MYLLKLKYSHRLRDMLKFTFHYVSIKTMIPGRLVSMHCNLHSTMYLLKLDNDIGSDNLLLFTFHYVSIKTYDSR